MERRNRRIQNTRRNKTAIWKRCIAAAAAMVTVLTGFNYGGLQNVFAEEKSGYQIDVSYSEDKANAVLTGNTEKLTSDTALTSLIGSDGTEYDPNDFEMTVAENGTYTYTLEYSVTAAETGQTVDRKETLKVTVDQIQTAKARVASETAGEEEPEETETQEADQATAEHPAADSESTGRTEESSEKTGGESHDRGATARSADAPETVPVEALEKQINLLADLTNSETTIRVYQYAYEERGLNLNGNGESVGFGGGYFAEELPTFAQVEPGASEPYERAYADAALFFSDSEDETSSISITGVFPYQTQSGSVEWYYTVNDPGDGAEATGFGEIQAGYLIDNPDDAEIRIYYQVGKEGDTKIVNFRNVLIPTDINNPSAGGTELTTQSSHWNVVVGGKSLTKSWLEAQADGEGSNSELYQATGFREHEYVSFQFKMPGAYSRARVYIEYTGSVGVGQTTRITVFDTNDQAGTGLEYSETSKTYSGAFLMPAMDADGARIIIAVTPTQGYNNIRWFSGFFDLYDEGSDMTFSGHNTTIGMARAYTLSVTGENVSAPTYTNRVNGSQPIWNRGSYIEREPGYGMDYSSNGHPYTDIVRSAVNGTSSNTARHHSTGAQDEPLQTVVTGNGTTAGGSTTNVPVREFDLGDTITMRFETAIYNPPAARGSGVAVGYDPEFIVSPSVLSVDVYPEQNSYYKADYDRYTYSLPKSQGESVSHNLPDGGVVTITCRAYNADSKFSGTNVYGENILAGGENQRLFQDGYMFTARGGLMGVINVVSNYMGGTNVGPKGDVNSGTTFTPQNMKWFAYEVTVEDCPFDFKMIMSTTGGAHRNAVLELVDDAQGSVEVGGNASNSSYLTGNFDNNDNTAATTQSLTLPSTLRSFMMANGSIVLGLKPTQGYSRPTVQASGPGSSGITTSIRNSGQADGQGRFSYNIVIPANNQYLTQATTTIEISAHPITFNAQYYYSGSPLEETIVPMGYGSGQSRNLVIHTNVPDALDPTNPNNTQQLGYYRVRLVKTDNNGNESSACEIQNPETGNIQWQAGDIVNFDDVYSQAAQAGFIDTRENYQLRIVPTAAANNETPLVLGNYSIYRQTSAVVVDDSNTEYPYGNTGFSNPETHSIYGPQNGMVSLAGFLENILDYNEQSNHHYKLGRLSKTNGRLTTSGSDIANIGRIYYLAAVKVTIDDSEIEGQYVDDNADSGTAALVDQWNAEQAYQLYTSVSGENSTIDLSGIFDILAGDTGTSSIQGFQIRYANGNGEATYYSIPDAQSLELSALTGDVWNALFGESGTSRGTVTLVPTFETVKPVTLPDGTTAGDNLNTNYETVLVSTGVNHTFTVQATFKYDDTPEAFMEIQNEDELFVALYEQDNADDGDSDGTGNFSFVKGSDNLTSPPQSRSADLASEPVISALDTDERTFTVTFTVTDNTNLTMDNGYSSYNYKDYQIIAWTESNGSVSFTSSTAPETLTDEQDDTNVPQVRSKIYVQKPIAVTDGYASRTEKFYEDTGSFTTSFDYDNRSEFTKNDEYNSVSYAIYRVQSSNSRLGLCQAGTINLSDQSVTNETGTGFFGTVDSVTATLSDDKIQLSIGLNATEGATRSLYKVYVWNESNGDAVIARLSRQDDSMLADYPISEITILKIPNVFTSGTTVVSQTETIKLFYEGDPFTISATFTIEGNGSTKETIGNLLDDAVNAGELQVALYKKNPAGTTEQRYQMFALAQSDGSGGLDTSFSVSTIESDVTIDTTGDRSFTVTFTKTSGDNTWDDGAGYYVYAWTGANPYGETVPESFGVGETNAYVTDDEMATVNNLIPSVKTNTTNVLGTQWNSMVTFPSTIVMEDDVVSDDRHIYSRDQYVTLTPIEADPLELPDPDLGIDVTITELADDAAGNQFNITADDRDTIAVEGYAGSIGDIGSSGAPVKITDMLGNLKFSTDTGGDRTSSLTFYLRSVEEPLTPAGKEYKGKIQFEFTKGSSTGSD